MTVHVVGAGLAGLAAATALGERGVAVEVWEAAAQAGGRCRSYFDPQLGLTIDNGNHLVLSGNRAVRDYLRRLGAEARLAGPREPTFPFVDLATGERWTIRPNLGPLPWWILSRGRGVPDATLGHFLRISPLLRDGRGRRVDDVVECAGPVWDRLLHPFLLAALNLEPERGAAELAGRVMRETLALGGWAYAPRIPTPSLAAAFVEPALDYLRARNVPVHTQRRLVAIRPEKGRIAVLQFGEDETPVSADDQVVLAAPPWSAAALLPGLAAPNAFESIVNGHFRTAPPPDAPPITAVLGAMVQWIFCFEDRISVTVSAANALVDTPREDLARILWAETARALELPAELPPWQIVKEKRATFEASLEQQALRPGPLTEFRNLVLAGDWTDTGLPATIEGAVRSGFRAADLIHRGTVR
jgi:squalene-associated FAD-dependent desaturase